MFKNIEEIKSFILWAKSQKIKSIQVGDLKIEISELVYAMEDPTSNSITENLNNSKDMLDTVEVEKETDEDLYWSSGPSKI